MNELLAAAKAVIEVWDAGRGVWDQINVLRAAVERAEKHEGVGFDKYWRKEKYRWDKNLQRDVQAVWTAATQAERERCREIVITMGGPDVPELLRQIDSGEE